MVEPNGSDIRRIEVITGVGRRRTFSEEEKSRVVEETLRPGAVVSDIARRHCLSPQQLFTWRRTARRRAAGEGAPAAFVPALLDGAERVAKKGRTPDASQPKWVTIEIEVGSSHVWLWSGVDPELATTIIRALKAST